MKKIKKILLFFVISCFIPCVTYALTGTAKIDCEKTRLSQGETTTCKVGAKITDDSIKGYSVTLNTTGDIEIISTSFADGWFGTPSTTNIDAVTDQNFTNDVIVATIKVKMKEDATTGGTIALNGLIVSHQDENGEFKDISLGENHLDFTAFIPKTTNDLTSLTITDCELNPTFNASTTSYTCPDTESSSINIKATHNGNDISGTGKNNLKYGTNTLKIVVTAESGTTKTYTIKINRLDNRDTTTNLSELNITNADIAFDPAIDTYDVIVPASVEQISINAVASSATSRIEGTGEFSINEGLNTFKITVIAENGDKKTYTINITKNSKSNVPSTTLTKLTYNGKEITLLKDTFVYTVGVSSNIQKVDLAYETTSSTTRYKIEGNLELDEGFQTIKIIVSDANEETKTYTLIVYKATNGPQELASLEDIKSLNNSVIINSNKYQDQTINKEIFELLNNTRSTIIYNVVNDYNGIIYSLNINKNANYNDTLNLFLMKSSDSPLTYTANIPANIDVTLFIENEDLNNKSVYLYSYNKEKNTYTLINDKVEIKNQYIKFISNGSTEYIISESIIKNEEKSSNKSLILCFLFFITGFFIAYISIILLKKIYSDKQKTEEPKLELPLEKKIVKEEKVIKENTAQNVEVKIDEVQSLTNENDLLETLELEEFTRPEPIPAIKEDLDATVFLPRSELLKEISNEK